MHIDPDLIQQDERERIDDRIAQMLFEAAQPPEPPTDLRRNYLRGRREALLDLAQWLRDQ